MKIKNLIIICGIVLMAILSLNNVLAFDSFDPNQPIDTTGGYTVDVANKAVKGTWETVLLVLRICAVAAFVIAGIRYMFSAPDAKADIKTQTIGLFVGAILVFGASFVIQFFVDVVKQVTGVNTNQAVVYKGTIEPANGRYSDYDNDNINDWDDDLKVENGVLVSGEDNIPDIYQQDSNNNGICDYEDLWLPSQKKDDK